MQNGPEELFAYFVFLRYQPFCDLPAFEALMKEEAVLDAGAPGLTRLRSILRPIMLRRTKESQIDGAPIMALPPRCMRLLALLCNDSLSCHWAH